MVYKDCYEWATSNLGIKSDKIIEVKKFSKLNKCSEINALLSLGVCTTDNIKKAMFDVYSMNMFSGDIQKINEAVLLQEISIIEMVENGFIAYKEEYNLDDIQKQMMANKKVVANRIVVLVTNPKIKLTVADYIKSKGVSDKLTFRIVLDEVYKEWKIINSSKISSSSLEEVMSGVELVTFDDVDQSDSFTDEYDDDPSSIINVTNKIFMEAVTISASDIHLEPHENFVLVRMRVDGALLERSRISSKAMYKQVANRIKVISNLDTTNNKITQSGKLRVKSKNNGNIDMRVSTMPTIYGEKITLRILNTGNNKIRTLEELGIGKNICEQYRDLMAKPNGIILLSGPTGSGKSSTLAATLDELDSTDKCLITIEDPVEYKLRGAVQVNVEKSFGVSFADVLREVLRQDPDIIMVGEIRDAETAKVAMQAANTGHLVFSTIHTNDAVSALSRLTDMGVDRYLVADNILGIVSQQLVRKLCPSCKEKYTITEEDTKKCKIDESWVGKVVYKEVGCNECNKSGYNGRTAVPELLIMDEDTISAVHDGLSTAEIKSIALKNGMRIKQEVALDLIESGETSINEIYRVFGGLNVNEKNSD